MTKFWSKIRYLYYKLLGKKPRYVYVPTKLAYEHQKTINEATKYNYYLNHTLWTPPVCPPIGQWIIDKRNFVVSELKKEPIYTTNNLYPFVPRITPKTTVRETIVEALKKEGK